MCHSPRVCTATSSPRVFPPSPPAAHRPPRPSRVRPASCRQNCAGPRGTCRQRKVRTRIRVKNARSLVLRVFCKVGFGRTFLSLLKNCGWVVTAQDIFSERANDWNHALEYPCNSGACPQRKMPMSSSVSHQFPHFAEIKTTQTTPCVKFVSGCCTLSNFQTFLEFPKLTTGRFLLSGNWLSFLLLFL